MIGIFSYSGPASFSPASTKETHSPLDEGLEFPADSVESARNNRPVVLLHGTLVEKDGIAAYRDFALRSGHPVSHETYQSITKGHRIEESTEIASKEVNLSRAEVAQRNVETLKGLNPTELAKRFRLNPSLYGKEDPSVSKTVEHLPELIGQVESLLGQSQTKVGTSLSGDLSRLESSFASDLKKAGVSESKASGIAREVLDTIAPKAILIGHSAGGFVAHNMVVNPETTPDDNPFTYDGGMGIGEAIIISSPVEKGLSKPAPSGIAGLPFYNFEKNVLRPIEKLPASRLAMLNPIVSTLYAANKSFLKTMSAASFMVTASLMAPATYLARPGNEQVEEGSEFFETYIKDKPIPDGVSLMTITSPLDQLSTEDRSALVTEQRNGHSLSMDLEVSQEDLQRERPTWTHVIMTEKPDSFKQQFAEAVSTDGQRLSRILDQTNDEGVRHEALSLLHKARQKNPSLLTDDTQVKKSLQKVAAEQLPFEDSASYLAFQLLQ